VHIKRFGVVAVTLSALMIGYELYRESSGMPPAGAQEEKKKSSWD
jgi:hypothetical protein